ncbi:heavy metal-responsive transcriptional regulator [Luteimonas sp. Y-2-2-4F]|nr:heavy metal-responsive transcriptional regulator [Luteimonas sp. Y-2-2-4F]MCD9030364.1 heavy metal-responsive transcriptional regulator [Luteimonas sp. Y-2-2-4F]
MQIGELSRLSGVSIDTVRYYERHGVLPAPARQPSGYRRYGASDVQRLRFVARAKALGFTLAEIQELLALSDRAGARPDANGDIVALRELARARLDALERKLAELSRVRDALAGLVEACPGHGPAADCPILGALTTETGAVDRETPHAA